MDFFGYLPVELIEKIFSYFNAEDLSKCSMVSVIWRETANNGNLWRKICEELFWDDPWALHDIESSFEDPSLRFQLLPLSDRLSPISEWKICYCQQKYIDYNWRRRRNAQHVLKDKDYSVSNTFFLRSKPKQCTLFYPLVKSIGINNRNTELNVMRIDGKPKLMYQHQLPYSMSLRQYMKYNKAILMKGNTITFIIEQKLKTFICQNNEFNMVCEYDLGHENKLNGNALKICRRLGNILRYFIDITSSYLVAACAAYFHVWDRKTGEELDFVNCPTGESEMNYFCLQGDCMYFVTSMGANQTELYEYNIVKKTLSLIDTIYANLKREILSNELYLILITFIQNQNSVSFYDRLSKKKMKEIAFSNEMDLHSIHNNLLFFLEGFEVKIMRVPSWTLETEFKIPYSKRECIAMHNVGQNLLIITGSIEALEVWDWKKKVLCSSINCLGNLVWLDPIRLVVKHYNRLAKETELVIFGFW